MQSYKITVVIPSYNRAKRLTEALETVYAQTRLADEVIVVDDGSTDDTEQQVRTRFSEVRYFKQPNQGVSAARNLGICRARYDWVALLDSDDHWQPEKLDKQLQALQQQPQYRICHSNEIWIRNGVRVNPMQKHRKFGGHIFQHCLPLCAISPSSVIIHRSVFDNISLFDESMPACEDYDLWLRICAHYPVLLIDEPLVVRFGGHEDQLSQKYWGMDRFRIHALDKIITSGVLTETLQQDATDVLIQKSQIYLQGAEKRGRHKEVHLYRNLINKHQVNIKTI